MKIQTFSVVVGGDSCNADCHYCVSKLTGSKNGICVGQKPMDINKRNFHKACRFAQMSNVSTVLLTGKGEPTLYQDHITRYLEMLEKYDFPFIELQTNGILFRDDIENKISDEKLTEWYNAGLTTISLSCAHYLNGQNKTIFGKDIALEANIKRLHKLGFSIRLSCVMVDGMIDNLISIKTFTTFCKLNNVEQLTIRPVGNITTKETNFDPKKEKVRRWIEENSKEVYENMDEIENWFDKNASLLLTLAHGAKVYDYEGQNISINSCLTRSDNPDDIRQLIFSSDGHLRFDWVLEGAIII